MKRGLNDVIEDLRQENDKLLEVIREAYNVTECNCGDGCLGTCTHSKLGAALARAEGK